MSIEGALKALSVIGSVFTNIVGFVTGIGTFLVGLGLTQGLAIAMLGIAALGAFIFTLEFMQQISKGLIVVLILWVVGNVVGVI